MLDRLVAQLSCQRRLFGPRIARCPGEYKFIPPEQKGAEDKRGGLLTASDLLRAKDNLKDNLFAKTT